MYVLGDLDTLEILVPAMILAELIRRIGLKLGVTGATVRRLAHHGFSHVPSPVVILTNFGNYHRVHILLPFLAIAFDAP